MVVADVCFSGNRAFNLGKKEIVENVSKVSHGEYEVGGSL